GSPRAWSQALYLAGGIPAQLTVLLIPWALVRWSGRWSFWSWPQWPVWLAGLAVMFLLIPVLTRVHRHRLRVTAGIEIPPQPPRPGRRTAGGIAARGRSPAGRRQGGLPCLAAPALAAAAIAAVALWLAGVGYALVYLYARALPPDSMPRRATYPYPAPSFLRGPVVPVGVYLTLAGIAALF